MQRPYLSHYYRDLDGAALLGGAEVEGFALCGEIRPRAPGFLGHVQEAQVAPRHDLLQAEQFHAGELMADGAGDLGGIAQVADVRLEVASVLLNDVVLVARVPLAAGVGRGEMGLRVDAELDQRRDRVPDALERFLREADDDVGDGDDAALKADAD